jgi:hypothetical protein
MALLLVVLAAPAQADKCIDLKLKAIGKAEAGEFACAAKVVLKGDLTLFDACESKVLDTYATAFAKAGACSGDVNDCRTLVLDGLNAVAVAGYLPGPAPSKCEAARWKASGKRAAAYLVCLTQKPATVSACELKADGKFHTAYDKVSPCGGDGLAGDVGSVINADFVDPVATPDGGGNVTALCPQPATTTTTTLPCIAGACPVPTDVCIANVCQDGCVINGVTYASGAVNPNDPCSDCAPGASRTAWSPQDGSACPTGLCDNDVCNSNVCFIDGAIQAAGTTNPSNPCVTCQPAVNRTQWMPGTTGTACPGGICVDGTCDPNVCFLDPGSGVPTVVQNGTGINQFLGDPRCEVCDVSQSRTRYSDLPFGTPCGSGCNGGGCNFNGVCDASVTNSECASDDCRTGSCNLTTGACTYTPKNQGGSCFVPVISGPSGTSDCRSSNGTCDAAGNCVRPPVPAGQACTNPTSTPCPPDAGATCDGKGACAATIIVNAVCAPLGCDPQFPQHVDQKLCDTQGCNITESNVSCGLPSGCAQGT